MALEGTLTTPFGAIPKKQAVLVGGGLAGILGIVWVRSRNQAASASASPDTAALDPAVYDTSTGQTWESEGLGPYGQDPNGGQFDSSSFTGGQVIGYDGSGNPIYGPSGGGFGTPTPNTGPGTFTSNAQWEQYAIDYLVNTVGLDGAKVSSALGKYLNHQPVTDAEIVIINQATGAADKPPVAGPNGDPPGFIHVTGGIGGGTGTVAHNPVAGLKVVNKTGTSVEIDWQASSGAKSYLVTVFQGTRIIRRNTVNAPNSRLTAGGLHPNTPYKFRVRAQPGGTGGHDANISVRTDRAIIPRHPVQTH
jgi:hypothetical protein